MKKVKSFNFEELEKPEIDTANRNLDALKQVELPYTTHVGKGTLTIDEIKDLQKNTVIPLNTFEGDLIPLVVGEGKGKIIAYGHFVIIDDGMLSFQIKSFNRK